MRLLASAFAIVVLAATAPVAAQSESALAEALFDAGRAAADAGDHTTACEKFRESQRLEPGVGTLLNIGECAEKTGDLLGAWQSFNEAVKLLDPTDKRASFANQRFEELDQRIAKLSLRLSADAPKDSVVRRDGVVLGAGSHGVFLPVNPADELTLVVSAPGHDDRTYRVTLAEGERRELTVQPGTALPEPAPRVQPAVPPPVPSPLPPAMPPAVETSEEAVSAGDVLGWTAVALGAVGLAAGVGLTIDLAERRSELDDLCDEDVCHSGTDSDVAAFNRRRVGATVSYVAGGVLVATGVVLLLAWPDDDATHPALKIAPHVGPGFAGLSAYGSF